MDSPIGPAANTGSPTPTDTEEVCPAGQLRLRLTVRGLVQGVGFRPFVYRLATGLGLSGWVGNSPQGVFVEVEGPPEALERFRVNLVRDKPVMASIEGVESAHVEPESSRTFEIRESGAAGDTTASVSPDLATCARCLAEVLDPSNRRYQYPFTNCTGCGPRFSIIESLPYDRPNTTMKDFVMCGQCRAEYDDPSDRRFHAQPNACSDCGPQLEMWGKNGQVLARREEALLEAARALNRGQIVAAKGLGGFHLMVAAGNQEAVRRLRVLKRREEKPLAVMFPSLESLNQECNISPMEEELLRSPAAPIVLLRRRTDAVDAPSLIAPAVAPDNPYLGVMLAYTPMHHLLLGALKSPAVATSGNLSDEPICIQEREAQERLGGIADLFLVHDRPIARHVDDSVVREVAGRSQILRRSRGYAPLPINLRETGPPVLAVGAHLKNSVALGTPGGLFVGQHIGDLETAQAREAFGESAVALQRLYKANPSAFACDAHPDYPSTHYAEQQGVVLVPVQHHHAHVLSCLADNGVEGPALGVAWDGTGFGRDGTVWGGEFLRVEGDSYQRTARFRPFLLPGGEQAIKEPRRSALGLLYEVFGDRLFAKADHPVLQTFDSQELKVLPRVLERRINSPWTSSVGRLFDAVAACVGLFESTTFEGQAAMRLEFALDGVETDDRYELPVCREPSGRAAADWMVDWEPMMLAILKDVQDGIPAGRISARFHNSLVEVIVEIAHLVEEEAVALTGGCFQNRYLTERAVSRLREEGFRPYWHHQVPPNDGGIAVGQVIAAWRYLKTG